MAGLELESVTKRYPGGALALKELSLRVSDREFLVLLGPTGAGKTTTLKVVAGLEEPDVGRVMIGGRDVTGRPANQRNVAMTFEGYALYSHWTVYQNIANPFVAMKPRPSGAEQRARVGEVARLLGIEALLDRKVDQLSGGQRQRVALARSLVRHPDVLLLDEPLSHVDAKIRHSMRAWFHHLQERLGTTVLYVTHDYTEALSLGTRVAVINRGVLQQVSPPRELYEKPANEFVARLVGQPEINILRCDVVSDGGEPELSAPALDGVRLPVHPKVGDLIRRHGMHQIDVGIRPQFIRIGNGDRIGSLSGVVVVSELLGTRIQVQVQVGSIRLRILSENDIRVEPRTRVRLNLETDHLLYFDPSSGENLSVASIG